jgi:hypothetical protein
MTNIGCWNTTKVDILPTELCKYNMDTVVLSESKKKGVGEEILAKLYNF